MLKVFNIVGTEIFLSLGRRSGPDDDRDACDDRQRALIRSMLRSLATQWYQKLAAGLA